MLLSAFVLMLAVVHAPAESICATYVGRAVEATPFEAVLANLPAVAPRGAYESTADYQRRLSELGAASPAPLIVRRIERREDEGLSYNPDRQILTVYDTAFGAGEINFSHIPLLRPANSRDDNFTSAIGFAISAAETGQDTYEATNGFGARVAVTRTDRQVNAIWERGGRLGQSQFLGVGSFRPVAQLQMAPAAAQDFVEGGSVAFLIVPKPPFQASGVSVLEASFSHPRERRDTINVIIADIQCAFLMNRENTVLRAFDVR